MTSTPVAASNTKELMDRILHNAKAAGVGDPDAQAALAAAAATSGKPIAKPTVAAPPPLAAVAGAPPAPDFVVRPNGERYYTRKMMGHADIQVLQAAQKDRLSVLFYGPPGCGKTALFEAAFTSGFEYVPGTGDTTVDDFLGGYVPQPGGGFLWIDGPLPLAMERDVPLLVDEVALIDPKVMAVVYSVMDGRDELKVTTNPDRNDVKAGDNFFVVGACNPNAPGARMSEALISRFQIHIEMGVDFQLMRRMGVPKNLVTAVQNMKKKCEGDAPTMSWYPAHREMLAFLRIQQAFGEDVALANVVSQAPEQDRAQVADVLSRGYAKNVTALAIK